MLVIDASVLFAACSSPAGFARFGKEELGGPPLLWPETRSALHTAKWRGVISEEAARRALSILESGVVRERRHRRLGTEAWRIADELGWAKTYDAEYLALASLLKAPLATLDKQMRRAAERLGLAAHHEWS